MSNKYENMSTEELVKFRDEIQEIIEAKRKAEFDEEADKYMAKQIELFRHRLIADEILTEEEATSVSSNIIRIISGLHIAAKDMQKIYEETRSGYAHLRSKFDKLPEKIRKKYDI